jgi:hypothetical protein
MGINHNAVVCGIEVNRAEHCDPRCSDSIRFGIAEGDSNKIDAAPPHDANVYLKNAEGGWRVVTVTPVPANTKQGWERVV